jgi:hypothetical protein
MGDVEALTNAIADLCAAAGDKNYIAEHIKNALAYAEKYYDYPRIAKKLAYMLWTEAAE